MNQDAELDVVIFGASGFTGQLVAEHFARRYSSGDKRIPWGMAGRSEAKLKNVRDEIGAPSSVPIIVADSDNQSSLRDMVRRAKAVITTAGPYQLYGSALFEACAEAGTDYLDLCGEPHWMSRMIQSHETQAKASGARMLFACGFDSIPSELGVWYCQEVALREFGAPVPRINGRLREFRGGVSGGSIAAGQATAKAMQADSSIGAVMKDPFALTPGFVGPPQPSGDEPMTDPDVGALIPFMLSTINTKNVHRSNFLMGHPYGVGFVYHEMMVAPDGAPPSVIAPPAQLKPGEGPSKEVRDSGRFDMLFVGIAKDGRKVRVSVQGDKDPGYGSTSKMIAETAISLVGAPDVAGGVWTPAAALQGRLMQRLQDHAGLTFKVE